MYLFFQTFTLITFLRIRLLIHVRIKHSLKSLETKQSIKVWQVFQNAMRRYSISGPPECKISL